MGLGDLSDDVEAAYDDLDDPSIDLDRETRTELAMLTAATDADPENLLARAVHLLFQTSVDTGRLDFHLRSTYDVTYDEYLSGMTYDEMAGSEPVATDDGDRRYQF
ncbi:hypothetical protein BRD17_05565 [Halobacteriales archaeon SW_7_68_16]|nr:MAG: hypothetical protein BRD17_05565 [Halobacteriales archaeon SW_7_68_16]